MVGRVRNVTDECPAPLPLTESLPFQLGLLGALVTDELAQQLRAYQMKPKHLTLMNLLSARAPLSQLDSARIMAVAPSHIVSLADHLAQLGVVTRERDPADRRRQLLALSGAGHELLAECAMAAADIDAELAAQLTAEEQAGLRAALRSLTTHYGAPRAE